MLKVDSSAGLRLCQESVWDVWTVAQVGGRKTRLGLVKRPRLVQTFGYNPGGKVG